MSSFNDSYLSSLLGDELATTLPKVDYEKIIFPKRLGHHLPGFPRPPHVVFSADEDEEENELDALLIQSIAEQQLGVPAGSLSPAPSYPSSPTRRPSHSSSSSFSSMVSSTPVSPALSRVASSSSPIPYNPSHSSLSIIPPSHYRSPSSSSFSSSSYLSIPSSPSSTKRQRKPLSYNARMTEAWYKPPNLDIPEKEGVLTKEGRIVTSMKKRHFELRGDTLYYYTLQSKKFKGSIPLAGCRVDGISHRPGAPVSSSGQTVQFQVAVDGPNSSGNGGAELPALLIMTPEGRQLFMIADSEEEKESWLFALTHKICYLDYLKKFPKDTKPDLVVSEFFSSFNATVLAWNQPSFLDGDALAEGKAPLEPTKVSEEALEAICCSIPFHPHLVDLRFPYCGLTDASIDILCAVLSQNKIIRTLDISNNPAITSAGAIMLSRTLIVNQSITSLDVSNIKIGDEGARAIVETMKTSFASLSALNLTSCDVGTPTALALASALRHSLDDAPISLPILSLTNNRIDDEGAAELARAAAANKSVREIRLAKNMISTEGIVKVASALTTADHVQVLDVEGNTFGSAAVRDLADLLSNNKGILEISLGGGRLQEQSLLQLAESDPSFSFIQLTFTR